MIKFKKITIQNFLSFGKKPTEINLDEHDSTLILGKNSDTGSEGYSRNGCVDSETEFLSPTGWKKISEWDNDLVAQYDKDTKSISYITPLNYIKLPCNEFYHFKNMYGMDMMLSEEHRILHEKTNGEWTETLAKDVVKIHNKLKNGFQRKIHTTFNMDLKTKIGLSNEELRVQVALMADGSFPKNYTSDNKTVYIRIKKERKQERLKKLLNDANISYQTNECSPYNGFNLYKFKAPIKTKIYNEQFWNCSNEQLKIICDEVLHWDGTFHGNRMRFFSKNKEDIDFIQYAFATQGYRGTIGVDHKNIYYLNITKQNTVCIGNNKKPEIKTVKSIDGFKYCFTVPSSYLVLRRNGKIFVTGNCGKSSIFQAISWVLFNEGISSIKQDAFVNVTNGKKMLVTLELDVDGVEYVIKRGRKPAICEVLKNGEPFTLHSVNTVDETIEKLIGINFDTFTNTTMLNTNTIPFMNMKPASQRNFMEKMLGLDILTERANFLKMKKKELDIEIKLEEQNKTHIESVYSRTQDRIDNLISREKEWDKKIKDEIEHLLEETKVLEEVDLDEQKRLIALKEEAETKIKDIRKELSELENKERTEINEQTKNIDLEFKSYFADIDSQKKGAESDKHGEVVTLMLEKEERTKNLTEDKELLSQFNSFIRDKERELKSAESSLPKLKKEKEDREAGICPECKQPHFDKDKVFLIGEQISTIEIDIKNIKSELEEIIPKQKELEESIDNETRSLNNDIKEKNDIIEKSFREEIKEIEKREKLLVSERTEKLTNMKSEVSDKFVNLKKDFEDHIKSIRNNIEEPKLTLDDCSHIVHGIEQNKKDITSKKNEINPYTEQVKSTKKELVEYDNKVLYDLKDKDEHYKVLIKLLTDNKSFVRKNLLDQYIPFINQKVEQYLDTLELPHRIKFNNDLTVDVEYMNQSISYGNMSNGERGRTNFAVSMAFRDLMSISGHQFNFLGIDELLDNGIDQSGFHAIFKLLKKREGEKVFIISHRDDLITEVDKIITVEKRNGFTTVHDGDMLQVNTFMKEL